MFVCVYITHLEMCNGFAECFPLRDVVSGLLKHELTTGNSHNSDQQAFLRHTKEKREMDRERERMDHFCYLYYQKNMCWVLFVLTCGSSFMR